MTESNLKAIWQQARTEEILNGLSWYTTAHNQCEAISYYYGLPLHTVAAIVSALSPRNKWVRNLQDCEQVIMKRWDSSVGTFNRNKEKAIFLADNPQYSHQDNLNLLVGLKTQSFCDNLAYPYQSQLVTVDSHAYNAYKGTAGIIKGISKQDYILVSQAYQTLASKLDLRPLQLQAVVWLTYRRLNGIK
jgi:hypothetical protein